MRFKQIFLRVLAVGTLIVLLQQLLAIKQAFEKRFDDTYAIKELWVTYDNLIFFSVLFVLFWLPLLLGIRRWGKSLASYERKVYISIGWAVPSLG